MNTSEGVFDIFFAAFDSAISAAFGFVTPTLVLFFNWLFVFAIVLFLFFSIVGGQRWIGRLVEIALQVAFWSWLIVNAQDFANAIRDSFVYMGLLAGGNRMSVAEFMRPWGTVEYGLDSAEQYFQYAESLEGWSGPWGNFALWLCAMAAGILVVLAYIILAAAMFFAIIGFAFVSILATISLMFAAWRRTQFIAQGPLGAVATGAFMLLGYALMSSIIAGIMDGLVLSATPTKKELVAVIVASLIIIVLALRTGRLVGSIVSGGMNMGLGAAGTMATAGFVGAAAVTGGAAAAGGAISSAGNAAASGAARLYSAGANALKSSGGGGSGGGGTSLVKSGGGAAARTQGGFTMNGGSGVGSGWRSGDFSGLQSLNTGGGSSAGSTSSTGATAKSGSGGGASTPSAGHGYTPYAAMMAVRAVTPEDDPGSTNVHL